MLFKHIENEQKHSQSTRKFSPFTISHNPLLFSLYMHFYCEFARVNMKKKFNKLSHECTMKKIFSCIFSIFANYIRIGHDYRHIDSTTF